MSMNLPKPIPLSDSTSRANPQWNIPLPVLPAGFSWTSSLCSAWERATECRTSPSNIWSLRITSLSEWNINKWINGTFLLKPRATRNPDSLSGPEEENYLLHSFTLATERTSGVDEQAAVEWPYATGALPGVLRQCNIYWQSSSRKKKLSILVTNPKHEYRVVSSYDSCCNSADAALESTTPKSGKDQRANSSAGLHP